MPFNNNKLLSDNGPYGGNILGKQKAQIQAKNGLY